MQVTFNIHATLLVMIFMSSALLHSAESESSRILRLNFDNLLDEQYDVEVILHERGGVLHHGYALLPEVDNLTHRIDLTPSLPIAFQDREGKALEVPKELQHRYAYKHPEFAAWKERYDSGEIDIVSTSPVKHISLSPEQGIRGVLDVLILKVDEANSAGRNNSSRAFRIEVDLKLDDKGQVLDGSANAYSYSAGDWTFGANSPKRQVTVSGGYFADTWKASPGSEFDGKSDWPMAHGPFLTGKAANFNGQLVKNLHDARLVWVAEDALPSGRAGGRSRGGFALQPYSWTTKGFGGFGAPIIADNKVFVFVHTADMEAIAANPATASDPFLKLGVEKESLGTILKHVRDTVYAYDAQTGKRLWSFYGKTGNLKRSSKNGMASTPCFYDGKVFIRGQGGVYALDANNGDVVWHNKAHGINDASYEGSITQVGGSLILVEVPRNDPVRLIALNPQDGSVRWQHERMGSKSTGIPAIYEENGKQYLVASRQT